MATPPQSVSSSTLLPPPFNVLLVDADDVTSRFAPALKSQYGVAVSPDVEVASRFLQRSSADLVVTELRLRDGNGVDLCRAAQALPTPPVVLVTTDVVESVPDALDAGCDGVLLKPFAPNLLYARIGRLLRARSHALRLRASRQRAKAEHLQERTELLLAGSNRVWPDTSCPYCAHTGVTSFDFASFRRAWYACLQCKKVWMAARREEL